MFNYKMKLLKCITYIVAFICTYCKQDKPITEKNFMKTLGSIFNNAKDWDGQRNVRRMIAAQITDKENPEDTYNDIPDKDKD